MIRVYGDSGGVELGASLRIVIHFLWCALGSINYRYFLFHLMTVVAYRLTFCMFQHNARGILSMANVGPNTNGSQFFICYAKAPHLNGLYTVFGRVIHGFEVLDLMEKVSYSFPVV